MIAHDIERLLAFADTLADAARTAILPFFRAPHAIDNKSDAGFDPVTQADRAAELRMRQLIESGEEFGETPGPSGYQWILDPIDGTRAFIAGFPLWGVLIGLYYEGRPLLGVMDQPYLDERYRGSPLGANITARGATRDLKTSACASLSNAILSTTDSHLFRGPEAEAFERVRRSTKLTLRLRLLRLLHARRRPHRLRHRERLEALRHRRPHPHHHGRRRRRLQLARRRRCPRRPSVGLRRSARARRNTSIVARLSARQGQWRR
jgi:hypothetical protein